MGRTRTLLIGGLALAAGCVGLLLFSGSAGAHKQNSPTSIEILGWGSTAGEGDVDYAYGIVRSANPKCVGGRTVEIKRSANGQLHPVDTAVTSSEGFWAGGGDPRIGAGGIAIVKRKRISRPKSKKHKHFCGSATVVFD
jgi:hypothetical protein